MAYANEIVMSYRKKARMKHDINNLLRASVECEAMASTSPVQCNERNCFTSAKIDQH